MTEERGWYQIHQHVPPPDVVREQQPVNPDPTVIGGYTPNRTEWERMMRMYRVLVSRLAVLERSVEPLATDDIEPPFAQGKVWTTADRQPPERGNSDAG